MKVGNENKEIIIRNEAVAPGTSRLLKISIDRLPTGTLIDIPVYVFNAKKPGPVILVQAGLHGDEINGIEIVRRMLQKKYFKVLKGAIIAVPILNVYGFIHYTRDVPDGRDVNRSFPGTKSGSMASRIAYYYTSEILAQIDFGIDLHTGGALRENFPQVRFTLNDATSKHLADAFNAPFTFPSRLIPGSFRNAAHKMGKPTIVYEAGESMRFNGSGIKEGIQGILNIMKHYGMIRKIDPEFQEPNDTRYLEVRRWLRAHTAGMFIPEITNGCAVRKGQALGFITDTYTTHHKKIKAPFDGYIISINHQAVVSQGDALFHIGK